MRTHRQAAPGTLRIIGGEWRGRKLTFPALPGLRPTADRVRETLFNWLAPRMAGARCLDLFAGSGALGLEALSRGAAGCDFIERDREASRAICAHLTQLSAQTRGRVINADALTWNAQGGYDIVFIDPPFASELTGSALEHIRTAGLLAEDARVYLELGRSQALPTLEPHWQCLRDKTAGDVRYLLLTPAPD